MKKFVLSFVMVVCFIGTAFAASNPFMDVPTSSWAYDAVSQLASRGVVSGYPDGTYKGNQPMTRYEFASAVARALAKVDFEKANKQDVELLKKLVVEFKDELDTLGVKVGQLDTRVAVLEENVGGWKFGGKFTFLSDFTSSNNSPYDIDGKSDFHFKDAEFHLSKKIDDKVSFFANLAIDKSSATKEEIWFKNFYVNVKLPYDIDMTIGRFTHDWSYYKDEEPWFGDVQKNGFRFTKNFGMGKFITYVNHEEANTFNHFKDTMTVDADVLAFGAKFDYTFNEKFAAGVEYNQWNFEGIGVTGTDDTMKAFNANFTVNPWNGVKLYGEYWWEKLDTPCTKCLLCDKVDDNPNAYRIIFDVNQDVLKVTSLWVEYNKFGKSFRIQNDPYKAYNTDILCAMDLDDCYGFKFDTSVWFARLDQRWTEKWSTFQRYVKVDNDNPIATSVKNYTFGVKYFYTPALQFSLAYDNVDYEGNSSREDDHLIRFQTQLNF